MTHDAFITDTLVDIFGVETTVILVFVLRKLHQIYKVTKGSQTTKP
jgi:hypothetical protein